MSNKGLKEKVLDRIGLSIYVLNIDLDSGFQLGSIDYLLIHSGPETLNKRTIIRPEDKVDQLIPRGSWIGISLTGKDIITLPKASVSRVMMNNDSLVKYYPEGENSISFIPTGNLKNELVKLKKDYILGFVIPDVDHWSHMKGMNSARFMREVALDPERNSLFSELTDNLWLTILSSVSKRVLNFVVDHGKIFTAFIICSIMLFFWSNVKLNVAEEQGRLHSQMSDHNRRQVTESLAILEARSSHSEISAMIDSLAVLTQSLNWDKIEYNPVQKNKIQSKRIKSEDLTSNIELSGSSSTANEVTQAQSQIMKLSWVSHVKIDKLEMNSKEGYFDFVLQIQINDDE